MYPCNMGHIIGVFVKIMQCTFSKLCLKLSTDLLVNKSLLAKRRDTDNSELYQKSLLHCISPDVLMGSIPTVFGQSYLFINVLFCQLYF